MDQDALKRQELLEQEMIDNGVARYKRGIARAKAGLNPVTGKMQPPLESNTSYGISLLKTYVADVAKQITADTDKWLGKPGRKPAAWSYLSKLDHETCAFITTKVILDNISGITPLVTMVNRISGKIEDQTRLDIFKIQDRKYYQATTKYMENTLQVKGYTNKRLAFIRASDRRPDAIRKWAAWPNNDKVHIGNALLEAFIKVTSDYNDKGHRIVGSGMVEKTIQRSGKKTMYFIQGTSKAAAWIQANQEVCKYFTPEFLPCIVKPKDWTSPTSGGYHLRELQKRKPLVKMQQRKYLRSMAKRGVYNCIQFYNAVNILQAIPWEVNSFVYGQMIQEFNAEHGIDMPSRVPIERPPDPDFFMEQGDMSEEEWLRVRRLESKQWDAKTKAKYVEWAFKIKKHKILENERISEILNVSRTVNTAQKFAYEDELYFVWTADFRSRLYPCGTALSPQGTDKSKALIRFKRGVPLGKDGLMHLCVHAAGVYGNDKGSLQDRIAWVHQNKEAFIETYNNPGSTREFWGGADKPYSFLAVCEELGQILQLPSSLQTTFISHIPCAQDGSCNGIQHYSAMLRDPIGASAVNLINSGVPADIYTECAQKVLEYIQRTIDTEKTFNGTEWIPATDFEIEIAHGWIEFGITRDCTKKPTMVIPYGGTKIGCRDTCREYLDKFTKKRQEKDITYENPFIHINTYNYEGVSSNSEVIAITWLHHLVWHALDETVVAARVAMKFLKDCTKATMNVSKIGNSISWTTPTGFRVYQEIKKTLMYSIDSHLEGRIQLQLHKDIPEIDTRRMQTSIAPNFVHSMDSSHLQMTVILANEMGVSDVACVHDSFGAHAGNCTLLHKAIRSTFIKVHSGNVLRDFWLEQLRNNPRCINELPDIDDIEQGEYDISGVLESTYFFR